MRPFGMHRTPRRRRVGGRTRRGAVAAALVAAMLMLAGCGGQEDPTMGSDGQAGDQQNGGATTVTGALAGNADLEGGCAWLETDDGSVEVVWPEGYRVTFDPVRLRGPDGEAIAEAGDEVTVEGRFAEDRASICQVGDIFEASAVVE